MPRPKYEVRYSRPALLIGTGLLVLVQLIGVSLGGAQPALQFGSMMFQPAVPKPRNVTAREISSTDASS